MGAKPRSKKEKALALAAKQLGEPTTRAARMAGVPESTLRYWIKHFESWDDSELESYIASKKRQIGATWALIGEQSQLLALDLCEAGDAGNMLKAATTAGISTDKLVNLGQPKNINQQSSGTANPLIVTLPDKAG